MDNKDNKDKLIEGIFEWYADEMTPPPRLLKPAEALLRAQCIQNQINSDQKKRQIKKRLIAITSFCVAIVFFISYLIYSYLNVSRNSIKYYSTSQLSSQSISQSELDILANNMSLEQFFPIFDDGYLPKYNLYFFTKSQSPAHIICYTRTNIDNSGVYLKITVELTKDIYASSKHFYSYKSKAFDNTVINYYENYINGEHITQAAFTHNNLKYYLETSSPTMISIETYYSLIV